MRNGSFVVLDLASSSSRVFRLLFAVWYVLGADGVEKKRLASG
jgi:hypothetical protein